MKAWVITYTKNGLTGEVHVNSTNEFYAEAQAKKLLNALVGREGVEIVSTVEGVNKQTKPLPRWEVFFQDDHDGSGSITLDAVNQDEAYERARGILDEDNRTVGAFIFAIGRIGGNLTYYVKQTGNASLHADH